jgi:YkoY family integral membrane protein
VTFEWSDLLTVAILVVLEGLLSGDNALVLAVMVLRLPEEQRTKALRYGILGAFVLRAIATVLAVYLVHVRWVSLVGGLYLLYLPYKHFTQHPDEDHSAGGNGRALATGFLGLSAFWATVVRVELTDLVFAVDSILVAIAMTDKTWVIITGGVLGILMMRLLVMKILDLVQRYPKLVDGAYIVVLWVGIKLVWEFLHMMHWVPFEIPKVIAIGMVLVLFAGSFVYARAHPAVPVAETAEPLAETAEEVEPLIAEATEDADNHSTRTPRTRAPGT